MPYDELQWTARFVVCRDCACLVLLWKTDVHNKVCPAKIRDPMRAEVRIIP